MRRMDTRWVRNFNELLDRFELYLEEGIDIDMWLVYFGDKGAVSNLRQFSDNPLEDLKNVMICSDAVMETDFMEFNKIHVIDGEYHIILDVTNPGGRPNTYVKKERVRLLGEIPLLTLVKYLPRIKEIKGVEGETEVRKNKFSLDYRGWWRSTRRSLEYLDTGPRKDGKWIIDIEIPSPENIIFQGQKPAYRS